MTGEMLPRVGGRLCRLHARKGPCHTAGCGSPEPRTPNVQVTEQRLKSKAVLETSVYHETQPNLERLKIQIAFRRHKPD